MAKEVYDCETSRALLMEIRLTAWNWLLPRGHGVELKNTSFEIYLQNTTTGLYHRLFSDWDVYPKLSTTEESFFTSPKIDEIRLTSLSHQNTIIVWHSKPLSLKRSGSEAFLLPPKTHTALEYQYSNILQRYSTRELPDYTLWARGVAVATEL
ncbi:hypothetical protein BT63DRAFT_457701 [Microthyrium microscopicum]|uniref:Uncharacterized protein n=1 Tax=Microthyrium microscopicum TaxID=703497 RepID=A0A6A6U529_9PEZI|nr:hypothetical protein BT63DRAFT_457701 [Microthyrium microscopicum]